VDQWLDLKVGPIATVPVKQDGDPLAPKSAMVTNCSGGCTETLLDTSQLLDPNNEKILLSMESK
jgi:hypothetical protein